MCSAGLAKKILIVFNVVFFLSGIALLGIGIWMRVDPTITHFLGVVNIDRVEPLLNHAGTIFIIAGAACFVIGLIGMLGAIRGHQALLFVYITLVIVIMLVEFIAACLALIYRVKMGAVLARSMTYQVKAKYATNTSTEAAWDYLQTGMKCCGAMSYSDYYGGRWFNSTIRTVNETDVMVPPSCCVLSGMKGGQRYADWTQCQLDAAGKKKTSNFLHTRGCYPYVMMWFHYHSVIMVITGFAVGLVQIVGLIAACFLRRALKTGAYKA